jgi:hypothetical protein
MLVKEFELVNEEKVERALNGTQRPDGSFVGGVKKADGSYDDADLIAEYDKLGGLILRGTDKVKIGSFYDFRNKKALKEPKVVFVYNINGKTVEVADGVELPGVVKAARILAEQEAVDEEKTSEEKAERKVVRRKK